MAEPFGVVYTVKETAAIMKVSVKTVRRMVTRGDLVTHRINNRNIRVDAQSVKRLLGLPMELAEVAPVAQKTQRTTLIRFDDTTQDWVGEIDRRPVRFHTSSREEAELRLAALERAVPPPGERQAPAHDRTEPRRWSVFQDGNGGFIIKYYDRNHKRRAHRIPKNLPIPVKTKLDAQRFAAVWYREHVLLAGEAPRAEPPQTGDFPSTVARRLGVNGQTSFATLANLWVTGELHRVAPHACKLKASARDDFVRLDKYVLPAIGHVPLVEFAGRAGRDRLQQVAAYAAEISPGLSIASMRQILQVVRRVLGFAVSPLMILDAQPIQRGDIPTARNTKAKSFLYPDEEAKLLGCTKVPLVRRLLFGVLAREGLRTREAVLMSWADVDLERGVVSLDKNKTDDPRAWVLDPSVVRALALWKAKFTMINGDELIFRHPVSLVPLKPVSYATSFRRALRRAGVTRAQLFDSSEHRQPIRAHDLRSTFVTVSLAQGKTEAWVTARTGHKSSAMVRKYQRVAATYAELNLGPLAPLDTAIPELTK